MNPFPAVAAKGVQADQANQMRHDPHVYRDPHEGQHPQEDMRWSKEQRAAGSGGGVDHGQGYDVETAGAFSDGAALRGNDPRANYDNYYAQQTRNMRNYFIARVYIILCFQLLLTIFLTSVLLYVDTARTWVQSANWMFWTVWAVSLVTLIVLFVVRRKKPWNAILLVFWTCAMSYTVAFIVSFYEAAAVLEAAILTALVTVSLTIFCFVSKKDFSFMGGALFTGLMILLVGMIIQLLFPLGSWFTYLFAALGALIFSLYILYDTSLLIHHYQEEEYIIAAVSLYLDIINLFLMLLALFGGGRNNN